MATFLIFRDPRREQDRNSSRIGGVIISAPDLETARADAAAAAPDGETKILATWPAIQLAASDIDVGPIWLGDVIVPALGHRRSGS